MNGWGVDRKSMFMMRVARWPRHTKTRIEYFILQHSGVEEEIEEKARYNSQSTDTTTPPIIVDVLLFFLVDSSHFEY